MRVHELAEKLGIAKADLSEFLELLGEKGHHLSQVSPEAELLARDHFAVELEPRSIDFDYGGIKGPEHWSTDGEVREVDTPTIDPTLPAATGDHVPVPDADRIPLLADNGAYRGTLCLDPMTAERLRAALKGCSVADATLHPARGELVAVTWPCYQKLVVRTDG